MADDWNAMSCAKKSWIMAVVGGVVIGLVLFALAGWSFFGALLLAIVLAVIAGFFLSKVNCADSTPKAPAATSAPASAPAAPVATAAPQAENDVTVEADPVPVADIPTPSDDSAPAVADAEMPTPAPLIKPSTPLAGQAELAARKGTWKYENKPASAAAPETPVPSVPTAADAPVPDPAAPPEKAKRAPVAADGKPDLMDAPRAEGADNLKLIGGLGPKLEQTLNELGIWHFSQIAAWRKKEIAWVDARLRFKGRIERDDWMSQAKILAKGGETEFSKKKKK